MNTHYVKQLFINSTEKVPKETRDAYIRAVAADPAKHLPLLIANASQEMKAAFDHGKRKEFAILKDSFIADLAAETKTPATGFNLNSMHIRNADDLAGGFGRSILIDNAAVGKASFHIKDNNKIVLPLAPRGYTYHGANSYLSKNELIQVANPENLNDILKYRQIALAGKNSWNPDKIYDDTELIQKHMAEVKHRLKHAALEKNASLLAAPFLHFAQNLVTRKNFLKGRKSYGLSFKEGLTDKPFTSKLKSSAEGFVSGTISPEYGAINEHMRELGGKLKDSVSFIGKRQLVELRQAARGKLKSENVSSLLDTYNNFPSVAKSMMSQQFGFNLPKNIKDIDTEAIANSVNKTKSLRVFDSLFRKDVKDALPAVGTTLQKNKVARNSGILAGISATTAADPVAGALNIKKFILTKPELEKIPGVTRAKEFLTKLIVKDPAKAAFNAGAKGLERSKSSRLLTESFISPLTNDIKTFSNFAGQGVQKAKINY